MTLTEGRRIGSFQGSAGGIEVDGRVPARSACELMVDSSDNSELGTRNSEPPSGHLPVVEQSPYRRRGADSGARFRRSHGGNSPPEPRGPRATPAWNIRPFACASRGRGAQGSRAGAQGLT